MFYKSLVQKGVSLSEDDLQSIERHRNIIDPGVPGVDGLKRLRLTPNSTD